MKIRTMTSQEVIKLLSGGPEGITKWNALRKSVPEIVGMSIGPADLSGKNLEGADLRGANLRGAKFNHAAVNADLTDAVLRDAILTGTNLQCATLIGADLTNVRVDANTRFARANVRNCMIDRFTLESLKDYGGLTKGDRMLMKIVDGTAELRENFSGYMHWVHVVAMVAFVFPYAWFLIKHWSVARFTHATGTEPLWRALLLFIWTGGDWPSGGFDPWLFAFFCYALVYNALRFVLLWKTKKLELQEQITGLPPIFSLVEWWRRLFMAVKFGFYANLVLMALHTWHFLNQRIPLPEG